MAKKADKTDNQTPADNAWAGAFAAYGRVFDQIKKNPGPAWLFVGTYVLFSSVSTFFQDGTAYPNHAPYEDIAYFIFLLAIPVYGLALADRKRISLGEFMRLDLMRYLSLFAASILYVLIVGGSLLLLIVPAIWTIAWFFVTPYVVVDQGKGPIKSLKASKRLAQNHKGKVWGIIGVSILLMIPAAVFQYIPFIGIAASAFVTVLSTGAAASLYRWLQHEGTKATQTTKS
jgi:hypothetical protein